MAAAKIARMPPAPSAGGVLSLLEESDDQLRVVALENLNEVVDLYFHEIADYLSDIEGLYEEESFPGRELAALVASQLFYHLEEYEDALRMALGAGSLFDLRKGTEYVEKVVAQAINEYIKLSNENFEAEEKKPLDSRLEDVVNRMFSRCMEDKAFKQGLGMALECRRLDMVKDFITRADDVADMLEYCQGKAMHMIASKAFRERVLQVLIDIYTSTKDINYASLCQCHFILSQPERVSEILKDLLNKDGHLLAFQISFDIVDNENQHFCNALLSSAALQPPADAEESTEEEKNKLNNLNQLRKILSGRSSIDLHLEFLYRNNRSDLLLLETIKNSIDAKNSITHNGTVIAHSLMQCGTTSDIFLRNNLDWLAKATNWAKFSATASLGVIHKGHIKESKSILSTYLPSGGGTRGSPYSEGGALYAMGIIHANHYDMDTKAFLLEQLHNAQQSEVLQHGACLGLGLVCMATADESIYEELKLTLITDTAVAGEAAAYAIGLVMVGSASKVAIEELLAYSHDTQHEKIIRACALALAMMMFRREEEAETLIQQMLLDKDAILRYGACFCIALAYIGTSQNAAIRRLLHISVSDVSDDVRRAAVMALGFVMCNVPDQLPGVVKLLSESYNPHVRYGAAMALGIACAGSAQLDAHNLLQPLMSDSSDFVRQGAILALGLLYMQTSPGKTERVKDFREKLRKVIGDKHEDVMTRFGAILASGIMDAGGRNSCASLFSNSGVLRRGSAIGFCLFTQMWYWFPLIHMFSLTLTPTALVGLNEKLKIPKNFQFKCGARPSLFAYPEPLRPPKKEEATRTVTAVLSTAAKAKALKEKKEKEDAEKKAAAGADVDMDDKVSVSNSIPEGGAKERDAVSVVSVAATPGTTVIGSAADSVAASDLGSEHMEVDNEGVPSGEVKDPIPAAKEDEKLATPVEATASASGSADAPTGGAKEKTTEEGKEKKDGEAEEKKEAEPTEEILNNPCRVLPNQKQYISFPTEIEGNPVRYTPLIASRRVGFVLLKDAKPEEPEELFDDGKAQPAEEKKPEQPPPESSNQSETIEP